MTYTRAELEALLAGATDGPWMAHESSWDVDDYDQYDRNNAFIAAARTAVPELLELIRTAPDLMKQAATWEIARDMLREHFGLVTNE